MTTVTIKVNIKMVPNESDISNLKIYIFQPETKTVVQSNFNQCIWIGKNKSDVLKVIENNIIPGGSFFCDLESNEPIPLDYTVVNDKKYETEALSDPSRIIIKDGIDKSYDKYLSKCLAPVYQNDNFRNSRGRKTHFFGEVPQILKKITIKIIIFEISAESFIEFPFI
jgi:hypothetical protein